MKLSPQTLKLARSEAHHHLLSDLNYTEELYRFLKNEIDAESYLSSDFGFKKFLIDYAVGRTLKGGDEAKREIVRLIKNFQFEKSFVRSIQALAEDIKQNGLSSNSGLGGPGLPQSFSSKFLYVYKPDELIPFDSYALKSLQLRTGKSLKSLDHYYKEADQFRFQFFSEKGDEVVKFKQKIDRNILSKVSKLRLDVGKLISWKLTDKYLWCEESLRRQDFIINFII